MRALHLTACGLTVTVLALAALAQQGEPAGGADEKPPAGAGPEPAVKPAGDTVSLELQLPRPAFKGTPKHAPPGINLEPPRKGPRPPLPVPKGTTLLSRGKPVTASDRDPILGAAKLITDGDKEASEGSYVEFGPGVQWVQIDLGQPCRLAALAVWHYHISARIYHDVVVQVSDDKDFVSGVRTLFDNDHDNSAGLGVGQDKAYWETYEGKLIDAGGAVGRYIRLYSNGSTADDQNHYTEVEVYGQPMQ